MITRQLKKKKDSVWRIITEDLGTVLRLVNDSQKKHCMHVSQKMIEWLRTELDILHRVISGVDTWLFEYEPESWRHRHHVKSPYSRWCRWKQDKVKNKVVLVISFDVWASSCSWHRAEWTIYKTLRRSCNLCFALCLSSSDINHSCVTTRTHLLTTS